MGGKKKKIFIKNILPLLIACVAALVFFLSYNHYLLDRTLANLKISLQKLEAAEDLELARQMKDVLDDTFIMEIAKEELDTATLGKVEFSSQILGTMTEREQIDDAIYFLRDTVQKKEKERPAFLNALDNLVLNIFSGRRGENENQLRKIINKAKLQAQNLAGLKLQEKYLEIARLYLRLKEWDQALSYLDKIQETDPDTPIAIKARLYSGVVYKLKGDYDQASEIFNQVKKELTGELNAFAWHEEGDSLYSMGKFEEAAEVFQEAFNRNPDLEINQLAQFRAGYIKTHDLEPVREKYPLDFFIEEIPEEEPVIEEEEAVETFKEIVRRAPKAKLEPRMARIYRLRGFELARQGYQLMQEQKTKEGRARFRLAVEQFGYALEIDPKDALSHTGKSISFYFLRKSDQSLKEAKKAKQLEPSNVRVLANLGYIYAQYAMLDQAIEQYIKAINISPNSYALHYNLGTLYAMRENYPKATVHLERAKQLNPTIPAIYNNLGGVYWEDKKYNRAKQEFEKGLSMDQSNVSTRYNLGMVLYNLGSFEEAKRNFDWVKKASPRYRKTDWYLKQINKDLAD